jgi:hypothetical protein
MAVELGPGPASMAGLAWLARVGPTPVDAWRCAMGWGQRAARSHAMRLQREGWLARYPMTRGDGSLLIATKRGVLVSGLYVAASSEPRPTWWAHHRACAWTAAWFTALGANWQGPREVLADAGLCLELEWHAHTNWRQGSGWRSARHRPNLTVVSDVGLTVVEVDLQAKSSKRRIAVLKHYRDWISEERIGGVIYVCATTTGRERIGSDADSAYFNTKRLRTMLLSAVRARAVGEAT